MRTNASKLGRGKADLDPDDWASGSNATDRRQRRAPRKRCHQAARYHTRAPSKLHFERNLNVDGTRVDPAIIEQERPAIVIQEFVERKLMCLDLREC